MVHSPIPIRYYRHSSANSNGSMPPNHVPSLESHCHCWYPPCQRPANHSYPVFKTLDSTNTHLTSPPPLPPPSPPSKRGEIRVRAGKGVRRGILTVIENVVMANTSAPSQPVHPKPMIPIPTSHSNAPSQSHHCGIKNVCLDKADPQRW